MNRKTVYMLVGLLVVMLAALGVGYALWFEDLKVHGDVTTGELDVQFSLYDPIEWFSDEDNVLIEDVPASKFAGMGCSSAFVDYSGLLDSPEGTDPSDDGYEVIRFTASGMYPSYHCRLQFDITNTGSVPVHFYGTLDDEDAAIHQMIVDDLYCIPENGQDLGCTNTIGYWSQHSSCGNATPRDLTWDQVGENTPFFSSGETWCGMFSAKKNDVIDNNYINLAKQYVATHLNMLRGAYMPAHVLAAYNAATAFFNGGAYPGGAQALLDSYNNGEQGVPHCDVVDEDGPNLSGDLIPIEDFQLHSGDSIDCFLELHFTNEDVLVQEGQTYSFQYHIRAYQWNEDDYIQQSLVDDPFNYGNLFP